MIAGSSNIASTPASARNRSEASAKRVERESVLPVAAIEIEHARRRGDDANQEQQRIVVLRQVEPIEPRLAPFAPRGRIDVEQKLDEFR